MSGCLIRSFDKTTQCRSRIYEITDKSSLHQIEEKPIIARGSGLSYCNASAIENGLSIDVRKLDKILFFDEERGFITVQSGITIGALNNFLIQNRWQIPVMPGYPFITVGGCIAFNVHGKSQTKVGLFIDWIEELVLYHPQKGELICSKHANEDVFNLTVGGFGLTGIIVEAKLKLKKIEGNSMEIKTIRTLNLRECVKIIQQEELNFEYIYSWNNFNSKATSFGKGIVYLENIKKGFSEKNKPISYRNRLDFRTHLPSLLNRQTIPLMCLAYYQLNRFSHATNIKSLYHSSFPIYGKEIYFHLFGNSGFREYQVLFDFNEWEAAVSKIERYIRDKKIAVSLASLKIFRGKTHNISFSGNGICLAIDVPNDKKGISFFNALDEIAIAHNGLANLSKDSRASHELISKTYSDYHNFKKALNDYDPSRLFSSDLRNRLNI